MPFYNRGVYRIALRDRIPRNLFHIVKDYGPEDNAEKERVLQRIAETYPQEKKDREDSAPLPNPPRVLAVPANLQPTNTNQEIQLCRRTLYDLKLKMRSQGMVVVTLTAANVKMIIGQRPTPRHLETWKQAVRASLHALERSNVCLGLSTATFLVMQNFFLQFNMNCYRNDTRMHLLIETDGDAKVVGLVSMGSYHQCIAEQGLHLGPLSPFENNLLVLDLVCIQTQRRNTAGMLVAYALLQEMTRKQKGQLRYKGILTEAVPTLDTRGVPAMKYRFANIARQLGFRRYNDVRDDNDVDNILALLNDGKSIATKLSEYVQTLNSAALRDLCPYRMKGHRGAPPCH